MANDKAPKNATNTGKDNAADPMDFSQWEEEQIGFAPYWSPEEGKYFVGQVAGKDMRDPEFVRYLIQASVDTECQRGPVDGAERVLVKKGEFFSISVYYSLADMFDLLLERFTAVGKPLTCRLESVKTSKTSTQGRKVWNWKMLLPPADKKALTAMKEQVRREQIAAQVEENNERKALQAQASS